MIRSTLLVLALSASVAEALPPSLTPPAEHAVATPVLRPYRWEWSEVVHLASDGRGFLAVFNDSRYGNEDALGWRYDERGEPIDSVAFSISATGVPDSFSLPIWNGTDYAVFNSAQGLGTYRYRVSPNADVELRGGNDLPDGIPVAGAWNGTRFGIAFIAGNELRVHFYDVWLAETASVVINDTADAPLSAAVATDGDNFLIVWETAKPGEHRLYGRVIDRRGSALGAQQLIGSELATTGGDGREFARFSPALSWNGSQYLLAWTQTRSLEMTVIDAQGAIGGLVSLAGTPGSAAIARDGVAHLVVWMDAGKTKSALVASTGNVLETFDIGPASFPLALASNGRSFFLIAGGLRAIIHSTGADRVTLLGDASRAYLPQNSPHITGNASAALIAWSEQAHVYASRMTREGRTLDGSGIDVSGAEYAGIGFTAATAGDVHLIAWLNTTGYSVTLARLTAAGERIEAQHVAGGSPPLVAANDDGFLIVTTRGESFSYAKTLSATSLPARGPMRTPTVIASPALMGAQLHALFWTGREWALLWKHDLDPPCSSAFCTQRSEERLTLLDANGAMTGDMAVPLTGVFIAAAIANGQIVVVTRINRAFVTRRLALDGSTSAATSIPSEIDPASASLVATSDGLRLFFGIQTTFFPSGYLETRMLPLDASGKPTGPARTIATNALLGNAARAFDATWFTYMQIWQPLPSSHIEGVARSFFDVSQPRMRSVGRR